MDTRFDSHACTSMYTTHFVKVLGILFNCSEPEAITIAFRRLHDVDEDGSDPRTGLKKSSVIQRLNDCGIVLGAYANRLTPIDPEWTLAESESSQPMRNDLTEQEYWDNFISIWIRRYNVKVVGGCCGIRPSHISYIRSRLPKT